MLYPDRLPRFTRREPGAAASELVERFCVPQWDSSESVESRRAVLPYPAADLVVEPEGVTPWGVSAAAEAAQRVREDPSASFIAAELGYADQAHLAGDVRTVRGLTASDYRSGS